MILHKFNRTQNENPLVVEPFVNIYEEGPEVVVTLEMPGVDRESLSIELDNHELRVRGRKRKEDVPNEYTAVYRERATVEYQRSFEVNAQIDREKIQAGYENGVLKIVLPKAEVSQSRKIEIKN